LTRAEYLVGVQTQNEDFVYDKLGNRTTLKHNGTDVARYQHNDVNEYTYIGLGSGTNVTHDDAGNMTGDHDGYTYHYDYENRLTRVKKSSRVPCPRLRGHVYTNVAGWAFSPPSSLSFLRGQDTKRSEEPR